MEAKYPKQVTYRHQLIPKTNSREDKLIKGIHTEPPFRKTSFHFFTYSKPTFSQTT